MSVMCRLFGHKKITAAVHNKNSMRSTIHIMTRCERCKAVLETQTLSKKQSKQRGR